jgi:hypothetical protein
MQRTLERILFEALQDGRGVSLSHGHVIALVSDDSIGCRITNQACLEAGIEDLGADAIKGKATGETWGQFKRRLRGGDSVEDMQQSVAKLPKTQQELYDAMLKGVKCRYMPYLGSFNPNPYYFRSDTMKHCTAAAKALLAKGLLKEIDRDWRGHTLVAIPVEVKE